MIATTFLALAVTLAIMVGFKQFLPKVPNWLTVILVCLVAPALFVSVRIYQMLVEIGRYEAINGKAPPNVTNEFAEGLNDVLIQGALWVFLAIIASLVVLRVLDRRGDK